MNIFTSEVEMLRAECKEWEKVCEQHLRHIKKLKKKRQWVGLTPQERDEINEQVYGAVPHHVAFANALESKLKEKNCE